jgi:hypothetical protein
MAPVLDDGNLSLNILVELNPEGLSFDKGVLFFG